MTESTSALAAGSNFAMVIKRASAVPSVDSEGNILPEEALHGDICYNAQRVASMDVSGDPGAGCLAMSFILCRSCG
jgi:hypothetical protein